MFIITNKKSTVLDSKVVDKTSQHYCHYTRANLTDSQPFKKKNLIQCLLAIVHVHHSLGSLHCPKPKHKIHNTINYTNKPEK